MIRSAAETAEYHEASRQSLWLAAIVLGAAFFLTEHDLGKSRLESFAVTGEEMEASVETGDGGRQLGFSLVGALGLFFLWRARARPLHFGDPLAVLLLLYLAWCAASVAWSADRDLTAKRVVVLGFLSMGAVGMARQFSVRQVCLLATSLLAAYCALGIGVEIALGTFRPWSAGYRFSGTLHPNSQGHYCAALCLAAAALTERPVRKNLFPWVLFAAAAVLLVLTRSRSACAGLAVALPVLVSLRMPAKARLLAGVGAAALLCAAMLVTAIAVTDPEEQFAEAMLLGRSEEARSLSGRIPLWTELLPYVQERPLLGYGYHAFWSPKRIEDVSEALQWAIDVAHSVYLDTLLGVGLVGTVLLFAAVAMGTGRLAGRYSASLGEPSSRAHVGTHLPGLLGESDAYERAPCDLPGPASDNSRRAERNRSGYGFLLGLFVFGAVSGVLESSFIQPMFLPLIAGCGLAHVALSGREDDAP